MEISSGTLTLKLLNSIALKKNLYYVILKEKVMVPTLFGLNFRGNYF